MIAISIFLATIRPDGIVAFLNNLRDTADDPSSFEVLIKVDIGDGALLDLIEDHAARMPFRVVARILPRLAGYYSLHHGYNALIADTTPGSYFFWLLTDEIRIRTKGWDTLLNAYIGWRSDDVFRLKCSDFALKNYNDIMDCMRCPDNYALTTRRWIELAGGWGNFWGPDSWHQCIDYFLSLCVDNDHLGGRLRSLPIASIEIDGQKAGQNIINSAALMRRTVRIHRGWAHHTTRRAQENYFRLALRLRAHMTAHERGLTSYDVEENLSARTLLLYAPQSDRPLAQWSWRLPRFRLRFYVGGYKELHHPSLRLALIALALGLPHPEYAAKTYISMKQAARSLHDRLAHAYMRRVYSTSLRPYIHPWARVIYRTIMLAPHPLACGRYLIGEMRKMVTGSGEACVQRYRVERGEGGYLAPVMLKSAPDT